MTDGKSDLAGLAAYMSMFGGEPEPTQQADATSIPDIDALDKLFAATPDGVWIQCKDGSCSCGMVWANEGDFAVAVHAPLPDDAQDIALNSEQWLAISAWIATIHNAWPALRTQVVNQQRELDARRNILDANVRDWQAMFPDEIGNSWYYPGAKVKALVDGLRADIRRLTAERDAARLALAQSEWDLSDEHGQAVGERPGESQISAYPADWKE